MKRKNKPIREKETESAKGKRETDEKAERWDTGANGEKEDRSDAGENGEKEDRSDAGENGEKEDRSDAGENGEKTQKRASAQSRRRTEKKPQGEARRTPTRLSPDYERNLARMEERLAVGKNFDVIRKEIAVGEMKMAFFAIDGFLKDGELQKLLAGILATPAPSGAAEAERTLPCVECRRTDEEDAAVFAVLSGETAVFSSAFGGECLLLDLRAYPARPTSEPESDKVMQGARDGFVETLVTNTALIRRRVRDERLRMEHFDLGGSSKTDVVICYMEGVADPAYVANIREKIRSVRPKSLTLGFRSLAETLIRKKWYNPFPKVRTTERPDTAAAQVLEGNVLVLCDTSPLVMLLPTSIFHYLQQTDDYYYPPLTGSYLRLVRLFILLLSMLSTPLWYLALTHAQYLPDPLRFLIPAQTGALPILLQLYLAEIAVDGLKIASMNTPDMLSNSLSIVGALILGDFAVDVGWFCEDVILYTAFIAIANFAQQNHELGYAFKFMRMMILTFVAVAGGYGFLFGVCLSFLIMAKNNTVTRAHSYLYPLIPWDAKAMQRLLFRTKKRDFYR